MAMKRLACLSLLVALDNVYLPPSCATASTAQPGADNAEVTDLVGAEPPRCTAGRTTYHNGYRNSQWDPRVGTLDLPERGALLTARLRVPIATWRSLTPTCLRCIVRPDAQLG